MNLSISSLMGVAIAAATGFASSAIANPYPSGMYIPGQSRGLTVEEYFERTFFQNDREYFNNRSIGRQLDYIFGFRNSFPENEINRDTKAIHELYVELLEQQNQSDPILRTRDLPNPYCTSLLQIGGGSINCTAGGRELVYEEQPPR
jgi:hypothetical protein